MDFNVRLRALARLAQSGTEAAERTLKKELDAAISSLRIETDYDRLEQSLAVIDSVGYRFSDIAVASLVDFVRDVEQRVLTYSDEDRKFGSVLREYRNAFSLIIRAIEALIGLRYLEVTTVLSTLIDLGQHASENVRRKALEGLQALADYDLNVFYGTKQQGGIGAEPQRQILDVFERFADADIQKKLSIVLLLLEHLLSPEMKGTAWSAEALTLSRASLPANQLIADVRLRSINLLNRVYLLASTIPQKLQVISALTQATRTDRVGTQHDELRAMFVRDAESVLALFERFVPNAELQVIQKIEHNSYWIFFHAISEQVEAAALRIDVVISTHAEYQIYKTLIGFEGIFDDWRTLRASNTDTSGRDEWRKAKALEYAESITNDNYLEWRTRIFNYAQTNSADLATFPVFYYFLESFAANRPELALKLLSEDLQSLERFLIPMLHGLWVGPKRPAVKTLMDSWIASGRHLHTVARVFLSSDLDLDLLKQLLTKATELGELPAVQEMVSITIANYTPEKKNLLDSLMLPAIAVLTKHSNTSWIFDVWFRREMKEVFRALDEQGTDLVIRNLMTLDKIDYHAEEILYMLAEDAPIKVLKFLCERLAIQSAEKRESLSAFQAIPYQLVKLQGPLSKVPVLVVRMLREYYDNDSALFLYRGAHLIKTIFPKFPPDFETALFNLVRTGGEANIAFVLAILRNYEGEPFLHRLCKEIVRTIPADSEFRAQVSIVLSNTGVVSGELGMVEAYERKKAEVFEWLLDNDERVKTFAQWYISDMEAIIVDERKRAEERIVLRKHAYGEL